MAVSGLEMTQNSMRIRWPRTRWTAVCATSCRPSTRPASGRRAEYGTPGNYVDGANIAGFLKVANAMLDQGVV